MPGRDGNANQGHKIVGPNIQGKKEEYRLERRLQNGLFGGVYEARGLSSGRAFAVKVLHQSEIAKAQQADAVEFCEVPLSELSFIDIMRGSDHVMQVEDHFEDDYCHYIVFELAPGGDLLEALKLKPTGFEEHQAQFLVGQAARGLSTLHEKRLAMQDVSLENMLINYLDDGQFQIKICDPGQAILFEVDARSGEERPVEFHGFVGKSFRPPELHLRQPYLASKVDAWCLGWSTFYLLAAQPLFLSADPQQQDADWAMFRNGEVHKLFKQKGACCSQTCVDFIMRLMQLDPKRRISVAEALSHDWLADTTVKPMYAPRGSSGRISNEKANGAASPSRSNATKPQAHGLNGSGSGHASQAGGRNSSGLSPDVGRAVRPRQNGTVNPQPNTRTSNASGRAPSRGQAPAWKMAPVSRSESPSPGPAATGSTFRPGHTQASRNASPFGPVLSRDEHAASRQFESAAARQLGTPRRPERTAPRIAIPGIRNPATGSSTVQSGSVHHVEPVVNLDMRGSHHARPSGYPAAGAVGSTDGISSASGGITAATAPVASASSLASGSALGLHASADGYGSGGAAVASRTASSANGRPLGASETGHGSSAGVQGAGLQSGAGPRPASPVPQMQTIIRPTTAGRGYSPGPLRSLGSPMQQLSQPQSPQQQPQSPQAQQPQQPTGVPPAIGAARGQIGMPMPLETGGGHFWQSPRAASPGSTVIRAADARGRSNNRTNSPSQVAHSPTPVINGYSNPGSPTVMRAMSPNVVTNVPARQGFAWSPAPLSPPPNKRAVSPVPAGGVVLTGSPVPRWVA